MSKAIVNMTPNPSDIQTIHCSQGDTEAREWEFELHNNGEVIDAGGITEQMVFKSYKGGTEQILPENGAVPVTAPFVGDIKYPDATRNDQEFLYRQSPTEKDGNAKIKSLYGKTLAWNQLVQNGNFADGTNNWARGGSSTISASNNELTITVGATWNNDARQTTLATIQGHKYYGSFMAKSDTITSTAIQFAQLAMSGITITAFARTPNLKNTYQIAQGIATAVDSSYGARVVLSGSGDSFIGQSFTIKDVMLVDLTEMFGAGNEPSTVEEFTSLFSKPYYDYCQGAMLSFGGRNVKFNQVAPSMSSSVWVANRCTKTVSGNTFSLVGTNNASYSFGVYIALANLKLTVNHDYLFMCVVNTSRGTQIRFTFDSDGRYTSITPNKDNVYSRVVSATTEDPVVCYINHPSSITTSDTVTVKNLMIVDLTEMFGAGNEPSVEGFKELFPNDYYGYTASKYMNIGQPVSLKTVGKNIYSLESPNVSASGITLVNNGDGTYRLYGTATGLQDFRIRVGSESLPLEKGTYKFNGIENGSASTYRMYASYHEDGVSTKYVALDDGVGTFTLTDDGICVLFFRVYEGATIDVLFKPMLTFDYVTDQTFEPYAESVLSIPLDEFPYGMDGINDARDYKNETGYAKRIGQVDLGTLNWYYTSGGQGRFATGGISSEVKRVSTNSQVANIKCSKYSTISAGSAYAGNTGIAIDSGGSIWAYETAYGTDASAFKTAMSGVYLYYELNTPLENYGVVDLGTLNYTYDSTIPRFITTDLASTVKAPSSNSVKANAVSIYNTVSFDTLYSAKTNISLAINASGNISIINTAYTTVADFKLAMSGVYLLYEKENTQGFTTATLVTENGEVALANENGILTGKCNSDVSADAGFIEGKIKLSDSDGDVYSNKIQIHVERSPQ